VSEPDPKDLRRLKRLEAQLAKSTEEAKAAAAERRDLTRRLNAVERAANKSAEAEASAKERLSETRSETRERVRAAEERAAEAVATAASLPDQVNALVAENRRLAERLESVTADLTSLRKSTEGARAAADAARAEAKTATTARTQAEATVRGLQTERDGLASRLETATAQLKAEGKTPILPAAEAARQVGSLVDRLSAELPGLNVRDGEIRLKVAFGGTGDQTGFVIPTAESTPEVRETLHEVTLRFDQSG